MQSLRLKITTLNAKPLIYPPYRTNIRENGSQHKWLTYNLSILYSTLKRPTCRNNQLVTVRGNESNNNILKWENNSQRCVILLFRFASANVITLKNKTHTKPEGSIFYEFQNQCMQHAAANKILTIKFYRWFCCFQKRNNAWIFIGAINKTHKL